MTRSVQEIADIFKVEKDVAYPFIRFLEGIEEAEQKGKRPPPGGRGQGENVYLVHDTATVKIAKLLKKLT